MPERADMRALWILGLIVGPLVLVSIELFHPAGFTTTPGMFEFLRHQEPGGHGHSALDYFGPDWWFVLHMIQTPTVCLITVALILTVNAADTGEIAVRLLAWGARIALFLFAVYYTALDAIGGIGLGRTLELVNTLQTETSYTQFGQVVPCTDGAGVAAPCLSEEQVAGVALVLNQTWTDKWVGGVGSFISETGSWAVFFGALLSALTLLVSRGFRRMGITGMVALAALVGGGWLVQESHACCTGPTGFGLIFVFGCLTFACKGWKSDPS
ncbi:hypothetical protein [Algicella marina]|uniref:DUF4386 family protein n=1 Tax=Algicella marina TaxID=2683284 RepID=A0A6P1T3T4_9RHOB|nr:hypothetical protein [Algicella marina]QHQ36343.1 hypothetical protein GO499_14735 [Algicella marina]